MSRKRILIVDDEQHIVSLISMTLRRGGYEVITADNGPRALELARAFALDLVVMDFNMPGMTGSDLAERLDGKAPIIMVTARPEAASKEDPRISLVMTKPFSPSDMINKVQQLIGPADDNKELIA